MPDNPPSAATNHSDSESIATSAPLTGAERERYSDLDRKVVRGLQSFADEVADALLEIKRQSLWRVDFKSWGAYCTARLEMSRAHADRLAGFAEWRGKFKQHQSEGKIRADVEPPRCEGALRPLMALPTFDRQIDLYESLYDEVAGPPSRKSAAAAVKKQIPPTDASNGGGDDAPDAKPKSFRSRKPLLVLEMYQALDSGDTRKMRELIKELDRWNL